MTNDLTTEQRVRLILKQADDNNKGNIFSCHRTLLALEDALMALKVSSSLSKDFDWDDAWRLIFVHTFELGYQDLARKILLKMETDLDKTEAILFELKAQNAVFITKWLLNLRMPDDACRVSTKYKKKIQERLKLMNEGDPFVDALYLNEQLSELKQIDERILSTIREHNRLDEQIEKLVSISLYGGPNDKEVA